MNDLKFKCFNCHKDSSFEVTTENRDRVARIRSGPGDSTVTFLCTNCGYANAIELSLEMAKRVLSRLSSADSEIQNAIKSAEAGEYSQAFDIAKKKFGF